LGSRRVSDHKPVEWFWKKLERRQSNAILRQLKYQPLPKDVDADEVLQCCLKDSGPGGRPRVTTVDERLLLRQLGAGNLPDEGIRDVLVFASAYAVMDLHSKRSDLLPAEQVEQHIRHEAVQLIELHFDKRRQNDKRLRAFINKIEKVPGLAEIVAVHAVHAL
jgi:hypothetical protein